MGAAAPDTIAAATTASKAIAGLNVDRVILGDLIVKPEYPSFFPQDLVGISIETLYVCQWCFRYTIQPHSFAEHIQVCQLKDASPPGTVIYDAGHLKIHHVDGEEHKLYAQNLSLFAKLFLDTKSVFFDVSTFRYYILTLHDHATNQDRVVGFFSKEKMSWDNNNLACILVFPPWQRRGLGQVLMAASYELSKREGQLGGPEKPLSSLGRRGYLAYWSASIARCVRSHKGKRPSINDIVQETWIAPEDVIASLRAMDIVEPGPKSPSEAFLSKEKVEQWVTQNRASLDCTIDVRYFVADGEGNDLSSNKSSRKAR